MKNTNKITIIDDDIENQLFSTGFYSFRSIIGNIEYLKFVMNSNYYQNIKDGYCTGTTQKAINDENLFKILIPIPPLEEQKRIVDKTERILLLINNF